MGNKIRDILFKCGVGFYWFEQKVYNENSFLKNIRKRLTDMYFQEWYSSVQASSDNRIYKYLKDTIRFENYLFIPNSYFRVAITKIRLSSHLLNIERGRWSKLQLNDRICDLCRVIEDEFHVMIECPRYKKVREKYLPEELIKKPSMQLFINYIKCENKFTHINVGRFCGMILKEHKSYI